MREPTQPSFQVGIHSSLFVVSFLREFRALNARSTFIHIRVTAAMRLSPVERYSESIPNDNGKPKTFSKFSLVIYHLTCIALYIMVTNSDLY